jgi:hypothetical protein
VNEAGARRARALLFVLAVLVRLVGLHRSFFYDELLTVRTFTGSFVDAFAGQRQANNHPLASILAWAATGVLGPGEAAARLPSVLLGAVGVVALFALVRRRGGVGAASAAALLALAHPAHVGFSQEVRGYAGVLLFGPLALDLTLRLLDGAAEGRRLARLLALTVAAGLFCHLTLGLLVVGLLAYTVLAGEVPPGARRRAALALGGGLLLALVLYAPMASHLGAFASKKTFLADASGGGPTLERLQAVATLFTAGDARLLAGNAFPALAAGLALLTVLGAAASLRSGDRLAAAILTVLLVSLAAWSTARPLFHARFFAFLLPLVLALAGRGAAALARAAVSARFAPLVVAPLLVLLAVASAHRATRETQPTGKALAFARERGPYCVVGLGAGLLDPEHAGDAALEAVLEASATRDAVAIELFPELKDPNFEAARKRHGVAEKMRITLTGLTSDVIVHVLGPR